MSKQRTLFMSLLLFVAQSLLLTTAQAQVADNAINAEFRLSPMMSEAQAINLASLGIDSRGGGVQLFEIIIENVTDTELQNLYFRIDVTSSRHGVIAEIYTPQANSFSMQPRQVIVANNNNLVGSGLPGIPGSVLRARLTNSGQDFFNKLGGSTTLPDAVYSTTVTMLEGGNTISTGRVLASVSDNIGTRPIENVVDYALLQPGGPVGSGDVIGSRNPVFRWDGPQDQQYRIVIVEDRGQSPFGLIQGAVSTDPTIGPGSTGSTLLDFEMVDALVQGTSFQYPTSGVTALKEGQRYFWQVFAQIRNPSGIESRPTSIFEFTIPSASATAEMTASAQDSAPIITQMSPQIAIKLQQLIESGYEIRSIQIDGITYTGVAMLNKLEEFAADLQQGNI
ncbi:MAG: hypothetical protein LAT57_12805, partial [Balneolales bacterium]|nr:hypothetical protein [Balneolales bacterium]